MVDFYRIQHVKHVIETDYDTWQGRETASTTVLPASWNAVMQSILQLPIAEYVEPRPVSGEIDERRPAKKGTAMWNQNNGNGQGNGYGQPQGQQGYYPAGGYGQAQDVYDGMNNARDVGQARFPFINGGQHKLALATLEEFMHRTDGVCARALLKVLESKGPTPHQPGSFVVKIWKLQKPSKFPGQATDSDQFADFCRKLKGAPVGHPIGNDIRVLMKERPQDQLARGTIIDCNGVLNQKGNFVNIYWTGVPQDAASIAQMRARLEQEGVPSTAPQGGGQFQNAPHPAQMANQYPAQQGMPQQPGPQQGFVNQYQQQPMPAQQPPQQQQYAPQGQQPAQGVPPGGFLANVPPQGGNNGGGNRGGW